MRRQNCTAYSKWGLTKLMYRGKIVFGLVIPQEFPNHCNKAVPRCFLRSSKLLEEFLALHDLHVWSNKDTGFHFCQGKKSRRFLKAADSLYRTVTNCFIRPDFNCSGGNNTFRGSVNGSHLFLPTLNSATAFSKQGLSNGP